MIAIIDYGFGNLRSVQQALQQVCDQKIVIAKDAQTIDCAQRVVFPGQGAMPDCQKEIAQRGLKGSIVRAQQEKPFLGICLGLQLLFEKSEEGHTPGLGIFQGEVRRFPKQDHLKIPHMGWNTVMQNQKHPLWHKIAQNAYFYFVHSFYVRPHNPNIILGTTHYGQDFVCAIVHQNCVGVQFHPEKSAENGLQFLENFTHWSP